MARYAGFRNAAKLAEATFLPKVNKYHAKKTVVDGHVFHSKKEAERYKELKLLWYAGEIYQLECQVKYPLMVGEVLIAHYIADFAYYQVKPELTKVVEDCKGFRTKEYRLKKKLFEAIYGIKITET